MSLLFNRATLVAATVKVRAIVVNTAGSVIIELPQSLALYLALPIGYEIDTAASKAWIDNENLSGLFVFIPASVGYYHVEPVLRGNATSQSEEHRC